MFKVIRSIAAARALAGALLIFELLAANSEFHQALHHGTKAASTTCVVCLFAKGHADSPGLIPLFTHPVTILLGPALRMESIVVKDFTYLSFPSRAPPRFSPLPSVVA
jgi:hypothetical protein